MVGLFLWFLNSDTIRSGDDNSSGHVAEKTMVDDTADVLDISSHLAGILDGLFEVKIDNVVSIIGDSNIITVNFIGRGGSHTKNWLASFARWKGSDLSHSVLVAEWCYFNRDRESWSETIGQLGFVN